MTPMTLRGGSSSSPVNLKVLPIGSSHPRVRTAASLIRQAVESEPYARENVRPAAISMPSVSMKPKSAWIIW